jgi:hypothetical protein
MRRGLLADDFMLPNLIARRDISKRKGLLQADYLGLLLCWTLFYLGMIQEARNCTKCALY